jgi:hypothetical protein
LTKKCNELALKLLDEKLSDILHKNLVPIQLPVGYEYEVHKKNDLCHEISLDKLKNTHEFLKNIRSLSYPGKPLPFIIIEGKKIYLSLETS